MNEYGVIAQMPAMNEALLLQLTTRHPHHQHQAFLVRSLALDLLLFNALRRRRHESDVHSFYATEITRVIKDEQEKSGRHHHHHPGSWEFVADSAKFVTILSNGIPRNIDDAPSSSSSDFSKAVRLGIARGLLSLRPQSHKGTSEDELVR